MIRGWPCFYHGYCGSSYGGDHLFTIAAVAFKGDPMWSCIIGRYTCSRVSLWCFHMSVGTTIWCRLVLCLWHHERCWHGRHRVFYIMSQLFLFFHLERVNEHHCTLKSSNLKQKSNSWQKCWCNNHMMGIFSHFLEFSLGSSLYALTCCHPFCFPFHSHL